MYLFEYALFLLIHFLINKKTLLLFVGLLVNILVCRYPPEILYLSVCFIVSAFDTNTSRWVHAKITILKGKSFKKK